VLLIVNLVIISVQCHKTMIRHKLASEHYIAYNLREKSGQFEGIIVPLLSKGLRVALKVPIRESLGRYETLSSCPKGPRRTVPILHKRHG